MDFKTLAVSTPINFAQKLQKSGYHSLATPGAINDSGYFTPSPIALEKSPADDFHYDAEQKRKSAIIDATPVSTGRLLGLNFENDDEPVFTQLKTAFDGESQSCPKSPKKLASGAARQFDRLYSEISKSRNERRYDSKNNRHVYIHSIGDLVGKSRVDFVKELSGLNLRDVVSLIMKHVDDSGLCSMCCASKQWSIAVMSDLVAKERRRTYLESCTKEKENKLDELNAKSKGSAGKVSHSLLDDIINVQSNRLEDDEKPENADPVELRHYKKFVEAGQRLKPNEMLDKCPRCASPAKVNSQQKRAICSLSGCEFDYCTLCRCEYNFRHHCTPVKQRSMRLSIPNKKRSKKFLRRLLT